MELSSSRWCVLLTWVGSRDEAFFEGTITKTERDRALKPLEQERAALSKVETPKSTVQTFGPEEVLDVVSVFQEWSFLNRSDKRNLLSHLIPQIHVHRYTVNGLTLRFDGDTDNPSRKGRLRSAGRPEL